MMRVFQRFWAVFLMAVKRLLSQRGLALVTLLGLVSAVALILSIPLYADAVYYRVFLEEMTAVPTGSAGSGTRLPLAFTFNYSGATAGSVDLEEVQQLDAYFDQKAEPVLGLPQTQLVRYFRTDTWALFPQQDVAYNSTKEPLDWIGFAFISDLENHISLLEGSFPAVAGPAPDSMADVLVSEALALDLGLQIGETYTAFTVRRTQASEQAVRVPIRIAGIWRPIDAQDVFWFYRPDTFDKLFLVPEETFLGRLSPYLDQEVYQGLWHLIMDGSEVGSGQAPLLLGRITRLRQQVGALLPNTELVESPVRALRQYRRATRLLTILLFAFSVPIIGLTLAFISQVVGLSVERQRNATAVMRSRGATIVQLVGIAAVEGLLLGLLALGLGLPASEWIVQIMGRVRSFLDFSAPSDLRVVITPQILRFGLVAIGLALTMHVVPTLNISRITVVTFKQEQARASRRPWWQRIWLDILLLIPAAYGTYLLRQQGSIAIPGSGSITAGDPLSKSPIILDSSLDHLCSNTSYPASDARRHGGAGLAHIAPWQRQSFASSPDAGPHP